MNPFLNKTTLNLNPVKPKDDQQKGKKLGNLDLEDSNLFNEAEFDKDIVLNPNIEQQSQDFSLLKVDLKGPKKDNADESSIVNKTHINKEYGSFFQESLTISESYSRHFYSILARLTCAK